MRVTHHDEDQVRGLISIQYQDGGHCDSLNS